MGLSLRPQTLSEAFEYQAMLRPDRLAVACPERQYSYRELNQTADRIAAAILSVIGPGSEPVPVLLTQNSTFLAAMFGVLKAGKIFTALDPASPPARLGDMLADLEPRLLITDAAHVAAAAGAIEDRPAVKLLDVDLASASSPTVRAAAEHAPKPDDLAWIVWTSGSTGKPKGVTQDHRTALRMSLDYARLLGITPQDRLSLFHPNLTWDIFGALLTGSSILPFDIRRYGIAGVCDWTLSRELTYFRAFPTTFRRVMESCGEARQFPAVRLVHLSGEAVTAGDVSSFNRHFCPGASMLVLYGSSEGGFATASFTPHGGAANGRVSIGRPVEGVDLRVLNERGEPCGVGETGEIAIRSPYVFPGYWRRPELTQAAFLPGWADPEQRVFLTGDLASIRPDGELEYTGRKDSQVKIRGYRLELAEIELAMQKHPSIRMAAVRVFCGRNGEDRLAAYFVAPTGAPRDTELRRFLDAVLPAHMHPDRFVALAEMPTTANGKADRKALPAPDRHRPNIDTVFVSPRTGLEEAVARLFEEALDLEPVGAGDSFFELGGKSLAALRVLTRIAEAYGATIPPRAFFESPTPAATAQRILDAIVESTGDVDLESILREVEALGGGTGAA